METSDLIGKRVRIKEAVEACYSKKFIDVVGTLTFLGPNTKLGIPLQATIDRMPITLRNINQVQLEQDKTWRL